MKRWWTVLAVGVALFVAGLGMSITNVVLPTTPHGHGGSALRTGPRSRLRVGTRAGERRVGLRGVRRRRDAREPLRSAGGGCGVDWTFGTWYFCATSREGGGIGDRDLWPISADRC